MDAFQADRSPTHAYRTAPLRGLWTHTKGGFFRLGLTGQEKGDLIQHLLGL